MCVSQDCGGCYLLPFFQRLTKLSELFLYSSQEAIVFILGNKDIMQFWCPQTSGVMVLPPLSADPVTSYFIETWEAFGPPD